MYEKLSVEIVLLVSNDKTCVCLQHVIFFLNFYSSVLEAQTLQKVAFCLIGCFETHSVGSFGFRLETFEKRFCKRAMGLSGRRGGRVSLNGVSRMRKEVHS